MIWVKPPVSAGFSDEVVGLIEDVDNATGSGCYGCRCWWWKVRKPNQSFLLANAISHIKFRSKK